MEGDLVAEPAEEPVRHRSSGKKKRCLDSAWWRNALRGSGRNERRSGLGCICRYRNGCTYDWDLTRMGNRCHRRDSEGPISKELTGLLDFAALALVSAAAHAPGVQALHCDGEN